MRHAILLASTFLFSSCGGGTGLVSSNGVDGSSTMDGTTSTDGTKAPGGATATTCSILPVDPSIAFQETCSSFIPPLGNEEVVFVGQTTSGPPGNQVVAHRFRATASCGFDFVVSLPNLQFAADNQPYQMSEWWSQSANTGEVGLLAVVLRRSQPGAVLLGVAVPGSADQLNFLVSPLAVTMNGPVCTDPAQAGDTSQILEDNDAPLSCEDEAGGDALRLCHDGDSAYRLVAYRGSPDSTALPAVFGASDLLVPLD
jgi:hypothetical protein